jgi:hypothetical protein
MTQQIISRSKNTLTANRFLVGEARKAFVATVEAHKGEIGTASNGFYKATFKTVETAKKAQDTLNRTYAAHNVTMPEPKQAKGSTPTQPQQQPKPEPPYKKALAKLAGKGKDANKKAAEALRKIGLAPEGEAWKYWQSIR